MTTTATVELIRTTIREAIRAELNERPADQPIGARAAAARLGISLRKLDDLIALNELVPIRIGRKRLFLQSQLDEYVESLLSKAHQDTATRS